MEQEQFVGFDVSQAETSVCVVDDVGKVVWQGKCASPRRRWPQLSSAGPRVQQGSRSADLGREPRRCCPC